MFDDGVNVVTINLPERVKKLKEMEKLAKEVKKVEETSTTTDNSVLNEIFSVLDDDESAGPVKTETGPEQYSPLIRDYSIDMWNGSPGLHHWGWTNDKDDAIEK